MGRSKQSLERTYKSYSDDELLNMYSKSGILTKLAQEVLKDELTKRGLIVSEKIESTTSEPPSKSPPQKRLQWFFLFIGFVIIWTIVDNKYIRPNRAERVKTILNNTMESSNIDSDKYKISKKTTIDSMSTFVRLQFGDDASIEVPRNWTFFDQNARKHLNTSSEAVAKLAGVDVNQGGNQILVAANAFTTDKKPSATMRLSVRVGSFPSQADIKSADLVEIRRQAESAIQILQRSLPDNIRGMKLIDVRLEKLGAYHTVRYDKEVDYVSGLALDRLDVIYMGSKTYKLNTSYRKSEAFIFEPIILYIRQSFTTSVK